MTDTPERKNRSALWIILGVVAVILVCICCIVITAALVFGIANFTTEPYYYFIPLLSLV